MVETRIRNFAFATADGTYRITGSRLEEILEGLGITEDRFVELLSRDAYCPTVSAAPDSSVLTYTDEDGSTNHFREGQMCRWTEEDVYRFALCRNITDTTSDWHVLPETVSDLANDAGYLTFCGDWTTDAEYPAGAWVKFGGGDYIARKDTSLPPIGIAALSSTELALVSEDIYALMGNYEDYGNKDDWFEVSPAVECLSRTSAMMTLSAVNQKLVCSNGSYITVTLPSVPADGCEIWIAATDGDVHVVPSGGDSILNGERTLDSNSGWGVFIYDIQHARWLFK